MNAYDMSSKSTNGNEEIRFGMSTPELVAALHRLAAAIELGRVVVLGVNTQQTISPDGWPVHSLAVSWSTAKSGGEP